MRNVVVGMLGTTLDTGKGPQRWERWRPTVAICAQDDLEVARLDLLHPPKWAALAELVAADVTQVSPETEVRLHALPIDDPWDLEQVYGALHDFARGYRFDTERERYLIHITTGTHIAQICLFLLAESRHLPGELVQTSPLHGTRQGSHQIIDLDLARYDRVAARFEREHRDAATMLKAGIATRSATFNHMIDELEQVAVASRDPILFLGATGVGKSEMARRVYELKKTRRRLGGALVEVNCATIRGDGAMSALFGHVKGAFTGAATSRAGFLAQADGGALFLDEIGELGAGEQAMLLRALEEKRWPPLGSDAEVTSDFQLLAGTNRDLPGEVAAGRFRADLLARIDLWTFRLPGLVERREDIEPNVDHELERSGTALGVRVTMAKEARAAFLRFATSDDAAWPGNFRDLGGAIRRMATLAPGGRITTAQVTTEVARLRDAWSRAPVDAPLDGPDLVSSLLGAKSKQIDPFDRVQLESVLRTCRVARSLSDAGRRLFAISRTHKSSSNDADRLRKYLARFDLTWDDIASPLRERVRDVSRG